MSLERVCFNCVWYSEYETYPVFLLTPIGRPTVQNA